MLESDSFIIALAMTHSRIEPSDTRHEDDEQTGLAPKRTVDRS